MKRRRAGQVRVFRGPRMGVEATWRIWKPSGPTVRCTASSPGPQRRLVAGAFGLRHRRIRQERMHSWLRCSRRTTCAANLGCNSDTKSPTRNEDARRARGTVGGSPTWSGKRSSSSWPSRLEAHDSLAKKRIPRDPNQNCICITQQKPKSVAFIVVSSVESEVRAVRAIHMWRWGCQLVNVSWQSLGRGCETVITAARVGLSCPSQKGWR